MTITIDVTPETERRLQAEAEQTGLALPEYIRRVVEQLPAALGVGSQSKNTAHLTARDLLRLPDTERSRILAAAAEKAAPRYEADLALPPEQRALTALDGDKFYKHRQNTDPLPRSNRTRPIMGEIDSDPPVIGGGGLHS